MKNSPFWIQLRAEMKERRKDFLDSAHTQEKEVHKYQGDEYFYLDGYIITIPEHLSTVIKYRKHLFGIK